MSPRSYSHILCWSAAAAQTIVLFAGYQVRCSGQLAVSSDTVLDPGALLMPASATYGRAINGVSFQQEALLTVGDYQYATWYHLGASDEDVYLARRNVTTGGAWESFDTGANLDNGDATAWDAHNVTSIGISGDGRIHLSWDMHGHTLRYKVTGAGAATGATWDASLFGAERSSLNLGGAAINTVTYPRFVTNAATGNMTFEYRTGASGSGNSNIATFDATTGSWNTPHQFINGTTNITYSDPFGANSTDRNAYLNGVDLDSTGRMHVTWTWREQATGSSNHDIMYAYSDDGGDTWKNNAGAVVGTTSQRINLNSPGIVIVPMDRGNTLMNQQTQAVDLDGRVHMVMWHKTDDAPPVTGFTTTNTAYFHYFRNPSTGAWTRTELPTTRAVGLRPDMAYDDYGNIYVAYVSPGPGDAGNYYTSGDLVIAAASKAAGYEDWQIVYTDTRDWISEPQIDQQRLLSAGKLSLVMQENNAAAMGVTATPLRVLEFDKLANLVVWAGDHGGIWQNGPGANWDNDNDDVGETAFVDGFRVLFDDGAATSAVNLAGPVAPSATSFRNSSARDYVLTGAGIGGSGWLTVSGGGSVTLAGGANSYSGPTNIENGALRLTGGATIANSPTIAVAAGGTLDVTGTNTGGIALSNQSLVVDGHVQGNVDATGAAFVQLNASQGLTGNLSLSAGAGALGAGGVVGNLTVASGAVVQVGGAGLPVVAQTPTTFVDDFADGDVAEYVHTIVNDQNTAEQNIAYAASSGGLSAAFSGTASYEQSMLLRDDVTLAIGETLRVDLAMPASSLTMDLGLAISATATPLAASPSDADTRDTFDWASISVRPSANNVRINRSVSGVIDTTTDAASGVDETTVTGLYVTRLSDTQFAVGYADANHADQQRSVITYASTGVGAAFGFYADLRSAGSLGAFDNLRIEGQTTMVHVGETLAIDGDAALGPGSAILLDAFAPGANDKLVVTGELTMGGTLAVTLDPAAPSPMLGDAFDLFDFAVAGGSFDAYQLPTLASGLAWNVSALATTGELVVVTDVDANHDGFIDGADFLALQRTNPAAIPVWQGLYGSRLVTSSLTVSTAVPEPSGAVLAAICMAALGPGRRKVYAALV